MYLFTGLNSTGGIEFQGCANLKSVRLNKFLLENGDSQFSSCKALESVVIEDGDSMTILKQGSFNGCTSLVNFSENLLANIQTFESTSFSGCSKLSFDASLLSNVQSVGQNAFSSVPLFGVLNISKNTSGNIGQLGANNLTKIKDLGSVTTISERFVSGCPELKTIILPSTVTFVGTQAFRNSITLDYFVCKAVVPPTAETYLFGTAPKNGIFVPDESVEAYKTATNWSSYASKIRPLSEYVEL